MMRGPMRWLAPFLSVLVVACGDTRRLPYGAGADGGVPSADGGAAPDAGAPPPAADGGAAASGAVTFVVSVPDGTPAFEDLYLSGNQPDMGSWGGAGLRLQRQPDGRWSGTHTF